MGGLTQPKFKDKRLSDDIKMFNVPAPESDKPRLDTAESVLRYFRSQREEKKRAEEAERNQLNQQLEEVRQQREATQAQAEQSRIESEAKNNALANQQRALEQTGAVDDGGGGTTKPYNPTSSASTTVEGMGGERDERRKRNQLTAYLGI